MYYSTEILTSISETPDANVLDYFSQPQQGSRGVTGETVKIQPGSDPTKVNSSIVSDKIQGSREIGTHIDWHLSKL